MTHSSKGSLTLKKTIVGLLTLAALSLTSPALTAPAQIRLIPPSTTITQGRFFLLEYLADPETASGEQAFKVAFPDCNPEKKGGPIPPPAQCRVKNIPLIPVAPNKYRAYIGVPADMQAGQYLLKIQPAEGDTVLTDLPFTVANGHFYTQHIQFHTPPLPPDIAKIVDAEEALVDKARFTVSNTQLWTGPFMPPVSHALTGTYGNRRYLNGKYNRYHSGVDFGSPQGTPVKAPQNAVVTLARYFHKYNSNGNIVFLDHGQGVTSVAIHLSKILVKEGQMVKRGEPVGLVGSTGRSTGPHLHWGVYLNGQNTDGLSWIQFTKNYFPEKK